MNRLGLILGLVGGGIGLVAAIFGLAIAFSVMPGSAGFLSLIPLVSGVAVVVIVPLVIGVVFWKVLRPMFQSDALLKTGEPAQARVLRLWDTGVTLNDSPQVGMLLEVQRQNYPAYQVETKTFISRLQTSQFQPGASLNVRVDRADPNKIAVESVNASQAYFGQPYYQPSYAPQQQAQTQQAEEMMRQIDAFNRSVVAAGEQAQALIMRTWELGINVNGNNPALGLWLEVRPNDRPPFQAEAKGVVSAYSLAKFQPGQTVWVRFDPNDNTRVAVEHS
ncbi:MAG TPA: hypothetical protein VFA21_07690 [Pyrinomonadaceae bacterium]|nr:hypothetical protein [Pyrinomonadaceae bacterium]